MDQVEKILADYREEMIKTLQAWVRIPSVKGEAAPGAPFGAENRRALDQAMADCRRMGFAASDIRFGCYHTSYTGVVTGIL